jgi:hypothetical protein
MEISFNWWSRSIELSIMRWFDELQLYFGIYLFSISIIIKSNGNDFESKINWYKGFINFVPYGRVHEWNSKDPWWRRGVSLDLGNLILGTPRFSEEILEEREIYVPMPEGSYLGKGTLSKCTWKRRFEKKEVIQSHIEIEIGVPFEGKGENSWDQGMDRCYDLICEASSIEEGIGKFVGDLLERRKRYGGPFFIPEKLIISE